MTKSWLKQFSGALRRLGGDRHPRRRTNHPQAAHYADVELLEGRQLLSAVAVTVAGEANIYGAGIKNLPDPDGGGGGVKPVSIDLSSLGSPKTVDFPTVTGSVAAGSEAGSFNGADGGHFYGGKTDIKSWNGISGIQDDDATMFLVGVFLGANGQPAKAPATLNVTDANETNTFKPLIGQQFFIGNGRTSSQTLQTFDVPAGATRLYLGFADSWGFGSGNPNGLTPGWYNDDRGSLQVDVAGPNHAPAGTSHTVTTPENQTYVFATANFGFTDPNDDPPNAFAAVKITTLPELGLLTDNGHVVTVGQRVSVADIEAGKLKYKPATNGMGSDYTRFTFQVQDDGGTAMGGLNTDPNPKSMVINVS